MKDYEKITWTRLFSDCNKLADLIKSKVKPDSIVVITRGGLILAGLLSQILDIKYIDTICLESYSNGTQKKEIKVIKLPNKDIFWKRSNILLLDDLVDSGESLTYAKKFLTEDRFGPRYIPPSHAKLWTAVLYKKPDSEIITDFHLDYEGKSQALLPWENFLNKMEQLNDNEK